MDEFRFILQVDIEAIIEGYSREGGPIIYKKAEYCSCYLFLFT